MKNYMHDAIEFHLEGLRFEGEPVPAPQLKATYLNAESPDFFDL
jgi:hypothetical protein